MAHAPSSSRRHHGRLQACVTGASAGIGAAFAERLAKDGYDLILVARSRDRLEAAAKQLHKQHGITAEPLPADLTDAAELRIVERVVEDADLDLLVNNAGFGTVGAFAKLETDREEQQIRLNVVALVRLTRAALPGMLARKRGNIINVSSLAAFQPAPYNATYGATKAFVNSFTEGLHEELRGTGVRVQALCPGFTRTEFQARAGIDVSDLPSFVWMTPEAVVDAALTGLRTGDVVCVPGLANRTLVTLIGTLPRNLLRRIAANLGRRYGT
jgi:short-subunit dehydrogenase